MKYSLLLVLSIILLIGCSEDSPVLVNSNIHPFESTLIAINGNNSVTLVWKNPYGLAKARTTFSTKVNTHSAIGSTELHLFKSATKYFSLSRENLCAVLPEGTYSFTDSSVVNGIQYFYAVKSVSPGALGTEISSEPSNIASAIPYDYSLVTDIKFSEHIQPIFMSGCAYSHCHGGEYDDGHDIYATSKNHLRKITHNQNGFDITSWDAIMRGSDHGAVLVPYKSTKSHMFFHLNYDTLLGAISSPHMPFDGVNLPAEQVQLVKRWIDEGAQNDNGDVTLSTYPEGKVLVTNQAEDLISIVDIKTLLVSRYIQAGVANVFTQSPKAPHNLTLDKERNCYYVNLVVGGNIIKYNLTDNSIIGEVTGINSPTQIAITASGDTGFSAQFAQNTNAIRMFNTNTLTLYPQLISSPYINKPHGVQFTPDHTQLWVTGNLSDNMMVVDMSDLSTSIVPLFPDDTLPPGSGGRLLPYQTVMTDDNKYIYVSCQKTIYEPGEVRVIDRDSMKVVKTITVGNWPLIMAISPDNQYVYTANRNSNDVSVIRTSDNTVIHTIANVGPQPHGIALSSDGKFAYVSCENVLAQIPPHHPTEGSKDPGFLSVIDLTTYTIIKKIEMGNFAAGVAVVE